ncbi:MAG: hypothetical protein A2172_02370 [Candidatus Woykebacteria bacterium RBG_13_40_15]|uniref:Thymidylate synthase complementing protein ThyX n=1 Tax=Candidatus Woykebacteria bacterium RBG_13_40_15 TaxID=1802593 RepID=A0A1G1W6E9_9BACT|nr:MAG: hypothetical protein A2172_02370 [Candidatus Woykebacteria bacterium RBG_13_40_15]
MKYKRRIYPMGVTGQIKKDLGLTKNELLTEEEIAVVFARTSRSPNPFDEMAKEVTEEGAANFHERWVASVEGYGHSSVAEHAIHHLACEGISSLVVDEVTDNRLASFTEQSARYQVIAPGYFYTPKDIKKDKKLLKLYRETQNMLFESYEKFVGAGLEYIKSEESLKKFPERKMKPNETDKGYLARLKKIVTDNARFLHTTGRLSNVGVTANARTMEHMLRKLLSSPYEEAIEVGKILKKQAIQITPTLVRFADHNPYLSEVDKTREKLAKSFSTPKLVIKGSETAVKLLSYDKDAEDRFVSAFLYADSKASYESIKNKVRRLSKTQKERIIKKALSGKKYHDPTIRDLEFATYYLFEFDFDYGTVREYKRHRIQSYLTKSPSVDYGYVIPDLFGEMGWEERFREVIKKVDAAYHKIEKKFPFSAHYLLTRAHIRPMLVEFNLREAYHLFRLRTRAGAHYRIQRPILKAFKLAEKAHPLLWKYYDGPREL